MDTPYSSARALPQPLSVPTVRWGIAEGRAISFQVYDLDAHWPDQPALYIFAKRLRVSWEALHIGQARDLQERLTNHETWSSALAMGMTAVQVHLHMGGISERTADEAALIITFDPPLNTQGTTGPDSGLLYFDRHR